MEARLTPTTSRSEETTDPADGMTYEGEHDALIDAGLWQRVQDALRTNARTGGREVRNKYGALLKGLLCCTPCGTGMAHTCTGRNGKRYRYYVCRNARQRWSGFSFSAAIAGDTASGTIMTHTTYLNSMTSPPSGGGLILAPYMEVPGHRDHHAEICGKVPAYSPGSGSDPEPLQEAVILGR